MNFGRKEKFLIKLELNLGRINYSFNNNQNKKKKILTRLTVFCCFYTEDGAIREAIILFTMQMHIISNFNHFSAVRAGRTNVRKWIGFLRQEVRWVSHLGREMAINEWLCASVLVVG